jgi:hypothetical protein
MKNIVIIGAGQLGSRHLQGLLKLKGEFSIFVIDPSDASLQTAENRAQEIDHNHKIHYANNIQNIPQQINLAIIATGADVREQLIKVLLNHAQVDFLILEKVLFQDLQAYTRISTLLKQKGIKTWVNHPRRMFSHYQELKSQIHKKKSPLVYAITGSNWGLGCNALHYIDLICYLSDSNLNTLETNWLDYEIISSKRIGYIEFTGTLKGTLSNGDNFTITSFNREPSGITMFVASDNESWTIKESGASQIIHCLSGSTENPDITPIKMLFQSELTSTLTSELFESGQCKLPTYEEARKSHSLFIETMLQYYNVVTNEQTEILKIT